MKIAMKMVSGRQAFIYSMQTSVDYWKCKVHIIINVSTVTTCNKFLNAAKFQKSVDWRFTLSSRWESGEENRKYSTTAMWRVGYSLCKRLEEKQTLKPGLRKRQLIQGKQTIHTQWTSRYSNLGRALVTTTSKFLWIGKLFVRSCKVLTEAVLQRPKIHTLPPPHLKTAFIG